MTDNGNNGIITTKEMTLHMGPQHPSSHGVLHLELDMQGEQILNVRPEIGYLH
ncbi:NADH-quinone oxidoreductase subunit D, partial [bacterium]